MVTRADAIAREAARLFAERGYGATSIDDIGEAAGVSGPAIYWHFPGKQALLASMLTDISERLLAGGRRCADEATGPDDALARLIAAQVDFALGEPDLIVVHARELHHLDTEQAHTIRSLQRRYVDVWVDVLVELAGHADRARLAAAAQAAIGLINSTPYLLRNERGDLSSLLAAMAEAALRVAIG